MKNNEFQTKKDIIAKYDSKLIFWTLWITFIATFLIIIFHNININAYFKYIILPFSILLINYGVIVKISKYKTNKKAYIWLVPIILILISDIFLPIDPSNLLLNVLILPILISCFFFSMLNENYAFSRNFGRWLIKLFPCGIFSNLKYAINLCAGKVNEKNKTAINISLGIIIGLPIAIIVLNLLTSADKYFNLFIGSITNVFSQVLAFDFLVQNIFIFVFYFLILYTITFNIIKHKSHKEKKLTYYNVNDDISKTILIIVNTVFILFLVSEISKITTNFLCLPIEYTYAQYAREGFFQLLFVTAINFSIILFYLYYINKALGSKIVKRLLLLLIAFSILLIFNSYYRMYLYIDSYGFTVLRLQVMLFLLMELILFIIMIKKIVCKLTHQDANIFAIIIIITYIINLYSCIQPFIDFLNNYIMK